MRTPEGHMNVLQLLIEQETGAKLDNLDIWKAIQVIDHFADGQDPDINYGPHIFEQVGDLYELMAKWEGKR